MQLLIICFAAGTAWLQMQPALPVPALTWMAAPALTVALRYGVAAATCFACGFGWAAWCAGQRLADALPLVWEGADIRIVGVVAQLPQPSERSLRFEFDVERVLTPQAAVPAHIALSWWGSAGGEGRSGSLPELHAGERWQLTVRLRRPHGLHNPNGFDYEGWLLERDIRATGYVRLPQAARRVDAMVMRWQYIGERIREVVRDRIAGTQPGAPYAGVLSALAIGDQRAITAAQWQVFTRTGVNHLMSISGLHVTMIAGLAYWLAYFLWCRSPRLILALPARKAAALAGLLAALGYAWLSGFAVPAQRTVYMIAVVAVSLWSGRMVATSAVLCAALLVVVLFDPWAANSAGFWLSFGAVAVILFVSSYRIEPAHWLQSWARVQWAVTLGLAPLLVALFQQRSLVSPLANALAIPVVSLAVVPLTLLGVIVPGSAVLQLAHALMALCGWALDWMNGLPAAVWQQHAPPGWTVVAALAGVLWLLMPRGFPARWIGGIAVLPILLIAPAAPPEGVLRLAVLDVGQGLAVVAQTRNHAMLYDAGPVFGPQSDAGNRVIVPYLRAAGIRALDELIITHGDKDHAGGMQSVLQAVPVAVLRSSLGDAAPGGTVPDTPARLAGTRWQWDGITFEILHPAAAHYTRDKQRSNDRSCVLRIGVGSQSVLLTADIEQKTERELLQSAGEKLPARVMLVPHHGSRTSSSVEFVTKVAPQIALVATGYRNRFGHPKDDVLARYRALDARIYRTDLDGALLLSMTVSGDIEIKRQRASARRYWHAALENPDLADDEE